jgi:hypothetical protein
MRRSRYTFKRTAILIVLVVVIIGAAFAVMMSNINTTMTPAMNDALAEIRSP